MPSTSFPGTAKRSVRRAASRDKARAGVRYNGPAPRYEPARDLSCAKHYRQLPCKRCTAATA